MRSEFDRRRSAWVALSAVLSLAARGRGGDGGTAVTNLAPTVSLASPGNGTPGNAIALSATASDPDDGAAEVEFFDGSTLRAARRRRAPP